MDSWLMSRLPSGAPPSSMLNCSHFSMSLSVELMPPHGAPRSTFQLSIATGPSSLCQYGLA